MGAPLLPEHALALHDHASPQEGSSTSDLHGLVARSRMDAASGGGVVRSRFDGAGGGGEDEQQEGGGEECDTRGFMAKEEALPVADVPLGERFIVLLLCLIIWQLVLSIDS